MAEKKFVDNNGLAHFWLLLKERFVKKEHKTGSESEYKVLSDNNLTDELLQKIKDAGSSSFNGSFNALTDIPTLDGTEIKGTLTKEGLGIASKEDIPTDNSELENGAGYQTASDVESAIQKKGYKTEAEINALIEGKGYQTEEDVTGAIETATADFVTSEDVDGKITNATTDMAKQSEVTKQIETATNDMATKTQVTKDIATATTDMATQTWVNSQIANINKKEIVTSTEQMTDENVIYLMANKGSGNNVHDEYIVFEGKPEIIGTTEVDLTNYVQDSDLVAVTNSEIEAIFNEE